MVSYLPVNAAVFREFTRAGDKKILFSDLAMSHIVHLGMSCTETSSQMKQQHSFAEVWKQQCQLPSVSHDAAPPAPRSRRLSIWPSKWNQTAACSDANPADRWLSFVGAKIMSCWHLPLKIQRGQPSWRTLWRVLQKLKTELPSNPVVSILGMYPGERKSIYWRDPCTLSTAVNTMHNSQEMETIIHRILLTH